MAYIADACRTSYSKVLYRGSVPELLVLYHRSPNVYWTTSEIQDTAESALQFSASALTGSAQFGDLLIQWGQHVFNNVPSGNDTTGHVNFSRAYDVPPQVVVSCGAWIAIRGVWTYSISTSGFNCGVYQAQGSPQNVLLSWIALGKAS